jgi:DamX protein
VQTLSVPRFNEVQAASYLMYRLTVAGFAGESPFSSTEVRAIAKASGGLPGPMNALAREALRAHAGQVGLRLGGQGAGRRWLLPLLLGGLLLLVAGYGWLVSTDRDLAPVPPRLAERPLHLPAPPATGTIEPREPVPAPEPEPPRMPLPDIPMGTEEAVEAPESMAEEAAQAGDAEPAAQEPETPPVAEADGVPEPEVETRPEAEASPEPVEAPAPEVEAPEPDPAPAAPSPQVASPAGQGLDWIRAQAGEHYTLQLLVSRSEDAVRAFVERHGLEGELAWYHRLQNGQDRYTLVFGSYPDSAAAQAAITRLPAPVQRDKPWPRSFASVQAQLPTP